MRLPPSFTLTLAPPAFAGLAFLHQVNSAPRCLGHAGGMADLMNPQKR